MDQVPAFINNVVNKKRSVQISSFLLTPQESLPSDHCCLAAFNPVALPDRIQEISHMDIDTHVFSDVERHYPARHYVLVDDKLRILAAMKKVWGNHLRTVWPHQGHYALDPRAIATYSPAELTIERIGDLVNYNLPALFVSSEDRHAADRV